LIPIGNKGGELATLNAKETRLHLEVKKSTTVGNIQPYIESDFAEKMDLYDYGMRTSKSIEISWLGNIGQTSWMKRSSKKR
jgi:hypothetical protein